MTAVAQPLTGAPSTCFSTAGSISWDTAEKQVRRLQVCIAKATQARVGRATKKVA